MQVIRSYFIGLFLESPLSTVLDWQCVLLLTWDVPVSELNSNKSTYQIQQFHKFITWRLCVAQHVSGASTLTIRSLQLH